MLTHGGVVLEKKWTDVVELFVNHIKKMETAGKTDFIMFTIKPERGPVTDKIAVHKSGFRHFYHYAMTEAWNHIKGDDTLAKYMPAFTLSGVPVAGTKLGDVNHKIVIVLNDYDGGMDGAYPDVDLGRVSRLHSAVSHGVLDGVSSLAQGASSLAQGASNVVSQGASALTDILDSRALG